MSDDLKPDDSHGHGRRWLIVGVVVPISVALIGAIGVIVQKTIESNKSAATSVAATAAELPAADPIPAEWCFDCSPALIAVARDCRDGSMHACDDLWKTVMDPKGLPDAEAAAVHDYGISCGGGGR